jgi:hypothetical protein
VACSASGVARDESGESAHGVVRRVSSTVEAENESAAPLRVRDLRVRDPCGDVLGVRVFLGGKLASEAAAVVPTRRDGSHLGG